MSSENDEPIAVFVLAADGKGGDGAHVPRHEVLAPRLDTPPPISHAEETNTNHIDHEGNGRGHMGGTQSKCRYKCAPATKA